MEKEGLLLYNGRFNEKHDFVAMEIIDGQVQMSFSAGLLSLALVSKKGRTFGGMLFDV